MYVNTSHMRIYIYAHAFLPIACASRASEVICEGSPDLRHALFSVFGVLRTRIATRRVCEMPCSQYSGYWEQRISEIRRKLTIQIFSSSFLRGPPHAEIRCSQYYEYWEQGISEIRRVAIYGKRKVAMFTDNRDGWSMLVLPYLAILPHWPFPIHLEESRYFLLGGGTPPPNDSKEGKRTRSRGKLAKPYETFMLLHAENQKNSFRGTIHFNLIN